MEKAAGAFRTISEVADDLEVPQHVLRFWESKFPQIRPMKRGGGRRYYRPEDIDLLRAICSLLYEQGYTIKGVQKLMREGSLRLGGDPGTAAAPAVAAEDAADPALAAKIGQAEAVRDLPLFRPGLEESQRQTLRELLGELVELRNRIRQLLAC
jgi:DNA-binding transcriptional MerR regulator